MPTAMHRALAAAGMFTAASSSGSSCFSNSLREQQSQSQQQGLSRRNASGAILWRACHSMLRRQQRASQAWLLVSCGCVVTVQGMQSYRHLHHKH